MAKLVVLVGWQIFFILTAWMPIIKGMSKNGFAFVLQFFSLISEGSRCCVSRFYQYSSRTSRMLLDSIVRGKITIMHKIKKFSKSFFSHNICSTENYTNHSSDTLLGLVNFYVEQTLLAELNTV